MQIKLYTSLETSSTFTFQSFLTKRLLSRIYNVVQQMFERNSVAGQMRSNALATCTGVILCQLDQEKVKM